MRRYFHLPLLLVFLLGGVFPVACAQEQPTAIERTPANNVVALRKLVGQTATVAGRIESTGSSKSGHQFLNFEGGVLAAFCPSSVVDQFKSGKPAELFQGKHVELRGPISLFKGKLQIKLESPDHIGQIEGDPSGDPVALKPVELKPIGRDVWLSPAGLTYRGRDPAGLTRVEHIQRHMRDIPDRDGPHGVFDGEEGVAWAVIDEAWKLANKKKIRPRVEGDRSSYLVSMDRRIGYLGGRLGKDKGRPALTRVFIVFETDTTNIITAFPR